MNFPTFDLSGRVALVTGASRGIGRDLCLALGNAGATVVAAARQPADVAILVQEIHDAGGSAAALQLDVTNLDEIDASIKHVADTIGPVDIAVNNAGLGGTGTPAVDLSETEWDALFDVNLKGLFFVCQAVARPMIAKGCGRIINVSSQAGRIGIPGYADYCASKGAVDQLTRTLALEWAADGVTVNAVAPTFIHTPGTADRLADPVFLEGVLAEIPVGRVGTTMDVAAAVIFLASSSTSLITGESLLVDGGWTAH